jgi:cation diffusion facilitator family transporter
MSNCDCRVPANTTQERRVLWIAFALNATMVGLDTVVGLLAHSTGLLADALDMASDAGVYGAALVAMGRGADFKARVAKFSGAVLLILGISLLLEVIRRVFSGSQPAALPIVGVAIISLGVNIYVLRSLRPFQSGEVHLRAAWIFTRADVIASFGVVVSAGLVALTGSRIPDLLVGAAIGLYVIKEAIDILRDAEGSTAIHPSDAKATDP